MARIIRFRDCPPVPWKNGAGTTRELWALRDDSGGALVRISIAELSGIQTFSAFPGTDRVILQLGGPPMVLTIDGVPHRLARHEPLAFAGEADVACAADTAATSQDLNLMCRRGCFVPRMERIELAGGTPLRFGRAGAITALLALAPSTLTRPIAAQLGPADLMIAQGPIELVTAEDAHFILMSATAIPTEGPHAPCEQGQPA